MTPADFIERFNTPHGQKLFRYSVASAVAVVVSIVVLAFCSGILGWGPIVSSTVATAMATVPNYYMNRQWAWGKSGRSHLLKEVVPFWAIAFAGWALSTFSVNLAQHFAQTHHWAKLEKTGLVVFVYVFAFGILWVGKFILFNKVLFAYQQHHHSHTAEHRAAGDHMTGEHRVSDVTGSTGIAS